MAQRVVAKQCLRQSLMALLMCLLAGSLVLAMLHGRSSWLLRRQYYTASNYAHRTSLPIDEDEFHAIDSAGMTQAQLQGRSRMMLAAATIKARVDEGSSEDEKYSMQDEAQGQRPGSKPPECHNECARCQGAVCVPRPSFSHAGTAAQHATWTCSCLH